MTAVRGIGFDIDHTLAIDNRLERVALLRLLEFVLARGGRTLGTLADEIESIDALLARQRSGEFTIDDAVRLFVSDHGLEPNRSFVETFRANAVEMVEEFVVPLPGVKRMLETLRRRGIAVAVLSNGWNPLQARKALQAGFDGPVLVSSEIGERKPQAGAFDLLVARLGMPSDETWYVGDDPRVDVAGAQEAGIGAIWINWERREYPQGLAPPRHTILTFDELLELIPAPVYAL
jgi:HAD superfamily hydrolase (TIGR01509 family)